MPVAESPENAEGWSIRLTADGERFISGQSDLNAYVIWAVDENADGTPDYAEFHTVTYDLGYETDKRTYEETYLYGETIELRSPKDRDGYVFTYWLDGDGVRHNAGETIRVTEDITLTAQWAGMSHGDPIPTPTQYTVRYDLNGAEGGDKYASQRVESGAEVTVKTPPERAGWIFTGWLGSDGNTYEAGSKLRVTKDITLTAQWTNLSDPDYTGVGKLLNAKDHMAYMQGKGDGLFAPDAYMTRAEAAQMFYNLLLNKDVAITVSFTDVDADAWYAKAVNTLASIGVIKGVGNGLFAPEQNITRAEFITMVMRMAVMDTETPNIFPDVAETDWFYPYVVSSIKYGWIQGRPDGGFHPLDNITRAEAATVINRILWREADEPYIASHPASLTIFTDVPTTHWSYSAICEATTPHTYTRSDSESWTEITK